MKKRYWNDLSDEEAEKLEEEWENSKWYESAFEEAKKPNNTVAYLYLFGGIFSAIFAIPGIILIMKDNIENVYKFLGYILALISFVCSFTTLKEIDNIKNNYIDEQFNKWLLDKHNIIK